MDYESIRVIYVLQFAIKKRCGCQASIFFFSGNERLVSDASIPFLFSGITCKKKKRCVVTKKKSLVIHVERATGF